jgi:CDP-diacylglycerol---glycerol-3-phosphate 3-phosphatidyltransferase
VDKAPDSTLKRARRRSIRSDAVNIPNLLTFARILMIPLCLYFLNSGTRRDGYWSALVFTIAAITDLLDGFLARKLNVVSVLGKLLDPLADKLIVMATLVWMVPMGRMPAWAVVLLLARELSITGLRSVAASEGVVISAGQEGKTKTALQMIGIIALLLGHDYEMQYLGVDLGVVSLTRVGAALVYMSLVFSLASGAQYTQLFVEAVEAKEKRQNDADALAATSGGDAGKPSAES